ncbi:MAG: pitrilysin family protein [Gemmatimonadales bacterium]
MSWTRDLARTQLNNGLTAIIQRAPSAPVVAVVTHVRAGYFDEPDEWVGIAHVLEHMYFKGTARRGPQAIARETQEVGGYINAGTIYDKTVYYTVLPSSDGGLGQALDIQSDALRNAAIDADELSRELEVIIQEAMRKMDTPAAVTQETLFQLLFQTHRIRRWRIGDEEGLRRLTRDDLVAYYETRYTPDRTIISVVGDLDVSETLELVDRFYGDWNRTPGKFDRSPAETGPVTPAIRFLTGDVKRPRAALGWRTVDPLHADAPSLDVAADILGSGRGSHLYRHLRRSGIATSTSAGHYTPTEVGVFSIDLEADPSSFSQAVTEAVRRIGALRQGAATDEDIERVRALLQTQWLGRFESMEGRATMLCEAEALGGLHLLDEFYQQVMSVDRDDVVAAAERYLDPEATCVVALSPEDSPASIANTWSNGTSTAVEAPAVVRQLDVSDAPSHNGSAQEVASGIFVIAHDTSDLIIRAKHGTGLVRFGVHFAGIPTLETRANAGLSSLVTRCAVRGASGLSGEELAQAFERLGGRLASAIHADHMGWWVTVPAEHAGMAAHLVRAVAEHPNLDGAEVEIERRLLASDARRAQDDMFGYPIDRVLGEAFGDHAYGFPTTGFPDSVERITVAEVQEWARRLTRTKPVVVAVGDLGLGAMRRAMAPLLEWPSAIDGATHAPLPARATHAHEDRKKEQTALAMAFPAFPFESPERYALSITASVLSGLAGRLFDELRERRCLAYTVGAFPWLGRYAGLMLSYIATSPEREDEARSAMLSELRRLVDDPPDEAELNRAKQYTAGSVEMRQQRGRSMADEVLHAWMKGAIETVPEQASRLRAVTQQQVVEVASRVFLGEQRAEFVVRGVPKDN